MSTFITTLAVLGSKAEAVAGTEETLADTDFNVRVYNVEMSWEVENKQRKLAAGFFNNFKGTQGRRSGTVSFSVDLARSDTLSAAPNFGKLLIACGYEEFLAGAGNDPAAPDDSIVYKPQTASNCQTMTLEFRDLNCTGSVQKAYKMKGAFGNVSIVNETVGEPVTLQFEFTGVLSDPFESEETTIIGLTGASTSVPPVTLGAPATWDTYQLDYSTFTYDLGNTITLISSPADTGGYINALKTDQESSLSMTAYVRTTAEGDTIVNDWLNEVEKEITINIGTIAGSPGEFEFILLTPRGQIMELGRTDIEGIVGREIGFKTVVEAGDPVALAGDGVPAPEITTEGEMAIIISTIAPS